MPNLTFQQITPEQKEIVLPMVIAFYQSDAVDHPVPTETLTRTFQAVSDPENHSIHGYLIKEKENIAGFFYLTSFYCCEVGGTCIMIEEIFLKSDYQGKGYGTQALQWIHDKYPEAKRFRLEVTESNQGAIKLYGKHGYQFLNYQQMTYDPA